MGLITKLDCFATPAKTIKILYDNGFWVIDPFTGEYQSIPKIIDAVIEDLQWLKKMKDQDPNNWSWDIQ